jgi:hypothetical protein
MDGIPGELIFVLIFIGFSILEGVGRRRKAQQKKGGAPERPSAPRQRVPQRPHRDRVEPTAGTVDADRPPAPVRDGKLEGSEGLIPQDVWDEILGLARGSKPEPRRPAERPEPHPPTRSADEGDGALHTSEARSLEPLNVEDGRMVSRPERAVVLAGTEEAARPPARPSSTDLQASGAKAVAAAKGKRHSVVAEVGMSPAGGFRARNLFLEGTSEDLRKAIILTEVLGSPVSMRE